jgi:hypothetical protein
LGPDCRRGKPQTLFTKEAGGLHGAGGSIERIEQHADRALNFNVRVEDDLAVRSIDQAGGRADLELTAARLVEDAAAQAGSYYMEFGLAHRPFEAEQEPVVEGRGVVDTVLVKDQGTAQRTELDQTVPIGRVSGQSGNLEAHHDAGSAQGNLTDEVLEAVTRRRAGTGFTEIVIDHMDLFGRPARHDGAVAQGILTLGAFTVLGDLAQGRLTDVKIGIATQMIGGDFEIRHWWSRLLSPK